MSILNRKQSPKPDRHHFIGGSDARIIMGKDEKAVEHVGKLKVFEGVKEYPARVKCASLAWHTLEAALHNEKEVVSSDDETGSEA